MISFLVVSHKFGCRLRWLIKSLVGQTDDRWELHVAASGNDCTRDVVRSAQETYGVIYFGEEKIFLHSFPDHQDCKGYQFNQMQYGLKTPNDAWVVYTDADIIMPPNIVDEIHRYDDDSEIPVNFLCPEGRVMLTKDDTNNILWGNLDPYEKKTWNYIVKTRCIWDDRKSGIAPQGWFQCVRRKLLSGIGGKRYEERESYEQSDYKFGDELAKWVTPRYLPGTYVLHMDHGGSQWFGTKRWW